MNELHAFLSFVHFYINIPFSYINYKIKCHPSWGGGSFFPYGGCMVNKLTQPPDIHEIVIYEMFN